MISRSLADMHEADWGDLKAQLGQFSTKIDSNNVSIGKFRDPSFSTYAKFSEKLTFVTS